MRNNSRLFKIVPAFIGIVFVLTIVWYVIAGVVAFKVITEIDKNGLKGVAERIWEGNPSQR